jgi:hypothetical protein
MKYTQQIIYYYPLFWRVRFYTIRNTRFSSGINVKDDAKRIIGKEDIRNAFIGL